MLKRVAWRQQRQPDVGETHPELASLSPAHQGIMFAKFWPACLSNSGIYAVVCATNKPIRLTQAELEAHPAGRRFGKEVANHPPLRGWLAAPFVGRDGRNLGLIQLSDKMDGDDFTPDDEAILVQLAYIAAPLKSAAPSSMPANITWKFRSLSKTWSSGKVEALSLPICGSRLSRWLHSCLLFKLRLGLMTGNVPIVTLEGTRWPAALKAKDRISQAVAAFLAVRVVRHLTVLLFSAPDGAKPMPRFNNLGLPRWQIEEGVSPGRRVLCYGLRTTD